MARVVLEKLVRRYPGQSRPAVDSIDLDIQNHEFIVLVGPSGCGKSTTLRMVAGLEEISGGTITIDGRIVNDVPPKDRDIAMVFQNYALYPHMTVFKNMAFGLQLRRRELGLTRAEIESRVLDAARVLGIAEYLDRKPRALSGGQRQRVALGRAIVRNPKVFLFDEPLSNLDAKLRVETRAELKKLHLRLQTTTIYVTHDQEEAMTLGDRIVVMKDGVIQQCAPPLDVYDRPVNRFVAGFVGTPPMNFLEGRIAVDDSGGAVEFVIASQRIALPPQMLQVARAINGHSAVLGIRPEGLSPSRGGKFAGTHNQLMARINVVEPLGDKVDIYLTLPGDGDDHGGNSAERSAHLTCRADAYEFGKLARGATIPFFVDLTKMHLFEAGDNGSNLSLDSPPRV